MRMSASPLRDSSGFSLIELIVVMVLLGATAALVIPNLTNLYSSVEGRIDREFAVSSFNGLGRRAQDRGEGFRVWTIDGRVVFEPETFEIEFPEKWRVQIPQPVVFYASGACSGGQISIVEDGEVLVQQVLQIPFCHLENPQ